MSFAEQIKPRVLEALTGFLVSQGIPAPQRLGIIKIVERPFSSVIFFRAYCNGRPYDAVMKKVKHHQANLSLTTRENQAQVEYDMLVRLSPGFEEVKGCAVPEPIALFPDEEAYLMEYVPGRVLIDELKNARYVATKSSFQKLEEYYFLCGRWLKKFQELTGPRVASIDIFTATLERCEQKLSLIEEAKDQRFPPDLKSVVLDFLHEELAKLEGAKIATAGRHGDFGGWNILANESGIVVFDFLGSQEDVIAIDLLKMLVNIEDEKKYLLYSNKRLSRLKDSFLAGYEEVPGIQKPVALICESLHRICSLCASVTAVNELPPHRKIEKKRSAKEHMRWLLGDHKKLLWPGSVTEM